MENIVFREINNLALRNFWTDSLGVFFAELMPVILVFVLLFLVGYKKEKYLKVFSSAIAAGLLSRGFVEIIRTVIARPRPYVFNEVNLLSAQVRSYSFPSAHTAFFVAFSLVVYFYNKKLGLIFLVITPMISVARIYVGLHWPYDILAAPLVGFLAAYIVLKIIETPQLRQSFK